MKNYILIIIITLLCGCKKETPIEPTPIEPIPTLSFTQYPTSTTSISPSITLKVGELRIDKNGSAADKVKIDLSEVNSTFVEKVFVSTRNNLENSNLDFSNARLSDENVNILYENLSDTISLESGVNIFYLYVKIKDEINVSQNGQQVSFKIPSFTNLSNNQKILLNNVINVFAGQILIEELAVVDNTSYSSIDNAIDNFVVGKSVAEGFKLFVTKSGKAKVEVVGVKSDGSLPISHYWITNSTDEDFGVRVSNFNSNNNVIVGKTAISNKSFTINLVAGVNNVVFKTTSLYKAIPNGSKVGLKITLANGITYTSLYDVKSDSVDLSDKVVVQNYYVNDVLVRSMSQLLAVNGNSWGGYWITPKDANNVYVNNFPKIISMGLSTKFYADSFPLLDFTNKGNESFYVIGLNKLIQDIILPNQTFVYNKNSNYLKLNFNNYQIYRTDVDFVKYAVLSLNLNVFNSSTKNFSGNVGFDPYKGGWKFYGNPEMSIEYVSGANAQGYIFTQLY